MTHVATIQIVSGADLSSNLAAAATLIDEAAAQFRSPDETKWNPGNPSRISLHYIRATRLRFTVY